MNELVKLAMEARKFSYSPYSHFAVGCALEDDRGKIFTGSNVENANWSESICAERVAIAKMVSEGGKRIRRILVVTANPRPIFPCGSCRQVIQEFGADCEVIAVSSDGTQIEQMNMKNLFPAGFRPEDLEVS